LEEELELSWRDGAILLFTIEKSKVRGVDYIREFYEKGKMDQKTVRKHRDYLMEHGLLEKDYDKQMDAPCYFVSKTYKSLATNEKFKMAVKEKRSFSIQLLERKAWVKGPKPKFDPLESLLRIEGIDEFLKRFPRKIGELAAWIRYDPEGWATDDDDVKRAKVLLNEYDKSIPTIRKPPLAPDRYIFDWPDLFRSYSRFKKPLPRFFDLKRIYEAKWAEAEIKPSDGPVYLGIKKFRKQGYLEMQICVAVRREVDDTVRVIHVELDDSHSEEWVKALRKEFDGDCLQITPSTDEASVRRTIFHLNKVLEQRRLLIPSRYSLLLKDLRLFNFRYTPPQEPWDREDYFMVSDYLETAGNYVHALAASIWIAEGEGKVKRRHLFR